MTCCEVLFWEANLAALRKLKERESVWNLRRAVRRHGRVEKSSKNRVEKRLVLAAAVERRWGHLRDILQKK